MTNQPLTIARIAEVVGGTLEGDGSAHIDALATPDTAAATNVTFAADGKRLAALPASKAGAAIVAADAPVAEAPMPLIRVGNVQAAVSALLAFLAPPEDLHPVGVDTSARVAGDADIAPDARIGPGVVIHSGAKIASGCALCANVSIGSGAELGSDCILRESVVVWQGCRLGARVRIGPNSVIGFDGFGYNFSGGKHLKVPHIGNVVIEDDVDIGACTCVDRAKFGSTRIGAGTKIDNLVQVAHNVQVGQGCLLVALAGVAGSARLGNYVVLGGHVGVNDNIVLGDGVVCGAYSAVYGDVAPGQKVLGIPVVPYYEQHRRTVYVSKLAELFKQVRELEKRLNALDSSEDH